MAECQLPSAEDYVATEKANGLSVYCAIISAGCDPLDFIKAESLCPSSSPGTAQRADVHVSFHENEGRPWASHGAYGCRPNVEGYEQLHRAAQRRSERHQPTTLLVLVGELVKTALGPMFLISDVAHVSQRRHHHHGQVPVRLAERVRIVTAFIATCGAMQRADVSQLRREDRSVAASIVDVPRRRDPSARGDLSDVCQVLFHAKRHRPISECATILDRSESLYSFDGLLFLPKISSLASHRPALLVKPGHNYMVDLHVTRHGLICSDSEFWVDKGMPLYVDVGQGPPPHMMYDDNFTVECMWNRLAHAWVVQRWKKMDGCHRIDAARFRLWEAHTVSDAIVSIAMLQDSVQFTAVSDGADELTSTVRPTTPQKDDVDHPIPYVDRVKAMLYQLARGGSIADVGCRGWSERLSYGSAGIQDVVVIDRSDNPRDTDPPFADELELESLPLPAKHNEEGHAERPSSEDSESRGVSPGACGRPCGQASKRQGGGREHVPPHATVTLSKAENRWQGGKKGVSADGADVDPLKPAKAILNKLTLEKFDQLSKGLLDFLLKDLAGLLESFTAMLFGKAVDEPFFSVVYAKLCRALSDLIKDETVNFKRVLLTQCQKQFETASKTAADAKALNKKKTPEQEKELAGKKKLMGNTELKAFEKQEREDGREQVLAEARAKRHVLGNITFIGELYKLDMVRQIALLCGFPVQTSPVCRCQ